MNPIVKCAAEIFAKKTAVKTGKAVYRRRAAISATFGALAAVGAGYWAYKQKQKKKAEENKVNKYLPRTIRSLFKKI